jgi:hypothetical protein
MPTLGNSSIATTRNTIRIASPRSVDQLLHLARDTAERSSRLVIFCACESPWADYCHRHEVSKLLRSAARRRGVSLDVQEWPGGRPSARPDALRVTSETLHAVARGAKTVPLDGQRVPRRWAGTPWGTIVVLRAWPDEYPVSIGPPVYRSGHWALPRFDDGTASADDVPSLKRNAISLRRRYRLD